MSHPYKGLPERAYWKSSVSNKQVFDLQGLFDGVSGIKKANIATAGSCFAQHIGRALRSRKLNYLDCEPPPPFMSAAEADRFGYGLYSCRYGNVYTVRQLLQLFLEAHGRRTPGDITWERDGRYFDALRPGIEPNGFDSLEQLHEMRSAHLAAVRKMFSELDIVVVTLGLTEAWESSEDGTVYPSAPGVMAGHYDPESYRFVNFRYPQVRADLEEFLELLEIENPTARMLLTVSPVPLAATATNDHVLVATTQSKATLRAVAGDLAVERENVIYFPSYEVITGQPTRHSFYADNLRDVLPEGVTEVMRHFFPITVKAAPKTEEQPAAEPDSEPKQEAERPDLPEEADEEAVGYEHCEEGLLGNFAP